MAAVEEGEWLSSPGAVTDILRVSAGSSGIGLSGCEWMVSRTFLECMAMDEKAMVAEMWKGFVNGTLPIMTRMSAGELMAGE